jgi:hypothetical protein
MSLHLRTIGLVVVSAALIAGAIYMSGEAWRRPAPEDTDLARSIRERREAKQQPQVVYVPVPMSDQSTHLPTSQPTPGPSPTAETVRFAAPVVAIAPPALAVKIAPPAAPEPGVTPIETETDIRRKQGCLLRQMMLTSPGSATWLGVGKTSCRPQRLPPQLLGWRVVTG